MSSRPKRAPGLAAPPFPRAVRTYVGRAAEIRRVLELLDRETLFLVYGLAGIGKTEFCYKVIEEARTQARWAAVEPHHVIVRAGMGAEHVLAQLNVGAGLSRTRLELQSGSATSFQDDLAEVARHLDAHPTFVLIDDLHHLDTAKASQMLGYLSRHVRASRIFVSSRLEIPLPPGTPTPVVTRLQPLDHDAAVDMIAQLTARLGAAGDPEAIFQRSGGSPFYLQRELAGGTLVAADTDVAEASDDGSLEATLRELDVDARRTLLLFSVVRGRFTKAELVAAAHTFEDTTDDSDAFRETAEIARDLAARFLVDISRGEVMVHDLIRDALGRQVDDVELAEAHERAAELHLHRHAVDPHGNALDAVEAIHHMVAAGDLDGAWQTAQKTCGAIAAAGLDHLILDDIIRLHGELPAERTGIELLWARILLRRSLVAEAAELLERIEARGEADHLRYYLLAGEVAQRLGSLRRADTLFRRASELADRRDERFKTALQLADVRSLRGFNEEARAVLFAANTQLEPLTERDRARWGWSLALSYVIEEHFAEGAAAAAAAAEELDGKHDDLIVLLAMLEVVARALADDVAGARRVYDRVVAAAVEAGAVREHVASLYAGILSFVEGELRGARVALESSYRHLTEHGDFVTASIAGYFLGRAMIAEGEAVPALDIFTAMTERAQAAELATLASHGMAAQAEAHFAAGDYDAAARCAREALATEHLRPTGQWLARSVLARSLATGGDLAAARAVHAEALAEVLPEEATVYAAAGDLERAAIELMGGDPDIAIDCAARAAAHYADHGRRWMEARASIALAASLVARAGSTDLVAAERPLARAESLATEYRYQGVRARCAVVRAALLRREGNASRARELLMGILRELDVRAQRPEVVAVRAALQRADEGEAAPGIRATITHLGLTSGPRYLLVDREGTRELGEGEMAAERSRHELVVEPVRAVISVDCGKRSDRGRPMSCELLARLIEARGAVVTAEDLFRDVWGGREYHPLRHRNTVYVAVRRLRQTLRKLLGEAPVIETASGGWRIADGIDAASIRPAE